MTLKVILLIIDINHLTITLKFIFTVFFPQKPVKGFLFAKLYFEVKEYELAKK